MKRQRTLWTLLTLCFVVHAPPAWAGDENAAASPLDRLRAADIPKEERFARQPKEFVAVYGSQRWRHWGTLVQLSTDGTRVLGYSFNSYVQGPVGDTARVTDAATGKDQAVFTLPKSSGAGVSPGGRYVALCQERDATWAVTVWDTGTKKVRWRLTGRGTAPHRAAFSPNGKRVCLFINPGSIFVFDLPTGRQLYYKPYCGTMGFHPDGRRLFYARSVHDEDENLLRFEVFQYDLSRKREVKLFEHPKQHPWALAVSPDGRWVAVSANYGPGLYLWDVARRKVRRLDAKGDPWVYSLAFSPDGTTLACGTSDSRLRFYQAATGKRTAELGERFEHGEQDGHGVRLLAYSPDGRALAAARNDGLIQLWDVRARKLVSPNPPPTRLLAVAPDDRTLLLATGEQRSGQEGYGSAGVETVDVATGKRRALLLNPGEWALGGAFSPDGRDLALRVGVPGSTNVRLVTLPSGRPRVAGYFGGGTVIGEFYTPDGKTLITCSAANDARFYDTKAFQLRYQIGGWRVAAAALAGDGKSLLLSTDDRFKVIDLATRRIRPIFGATTAGPLAVSPDGTRVAVVVGTAVQVWSTGDGGKLYEYKGHDQNVNDLCFDCKGALLSCGNDGRVIRWIDRDVKKVWRLPGRVVSLRVASDRRHLFVNNGNGTVYVLRHAE